MEQYKSFYLSKTLWGALLLLLAPLLRLSADEQGTVVDLILGTVSSITQLVGFVLTVYGRLKAEKKLTT